MLQRQGNRRPYALPFLTEHGVTKLYHDYLGAVEFGNIFRLDVGPDYAGRLRDVDVQTLRLPHTGMAVTIDIGDSNNIHPTNKQAVSKRLSRWALGEVYGRKGTASSGPLPAGHQVRGDKIVLSFTHYDGGLQARGGELKGFVIAGEDHQWKPAVARLEGDKVIVSHPEIKQPFAVRYAWEADPVCNLYNGAGLPASPFRTDE